MATTQGRYYAISGIGWGRGSTVDEAVDNYVKTQLRNYDAAQTIFGTRPKFRAALQSGSASADVWLAPADATGFLVADKGLQWTDRDGYVVSDATAEQLVQRRSTAV